MAGLKSLLPPPNRATFARRAERSLRDLGITGEIGLTSGAFALRYGHPASGSEVTLTLDNVYDDCARSWPWQRGKILRRFLATTLSTTDEAIPTDWEAAAVRLLPAVRHRILLESIRHLEGAAGEEPPEHPWQPVAAGIVALLAYDSPTTLQLPAAAAQKAWGVSFEEALARAVENLEAISEPSWSSPAPGVYVSAWQDDYDASRILSNRALRGLEVAGPMVALVPDRNCLVVTGLDDPEALRATLEHTLARENPRPVSSLPLVRAWPGWQALELAPAHPCHALWRRVVLQEHGAVYGQQQAELQARLGSDVFVAGFQVLEDPTRGLLSFAVWTAGIVSLLPETDLVALVDPSRPGPEDQKLLGLYARAAIKESCGHRWAPTDDYPIRYRVEGFPSREELDKLPKWDLKP